MQDHSHKLLFMAATGAMCAVVIYGSQEASAFLEPEVTTAYASDSARPDNTGASRLPQRAGESLLPDKAGASVLPNSASCPAADALVSPPRVDQAIGKEPQGVPIAPAQAGRNANLGTGSACPPLQADAAKPANVPGLAANGLEAHGAPAPPP